MAKPDYESKVPLGVRTNNSEKVMFFIELFVFLLHITFFFFFLKVCLLAA